MGIGTTSGAMTTEEIVALNRAHTFFSWSIQGAVDPIVIDRAEGVWLYTPEGDRILDFNSQLMSVNIGHGDRRVIDAITEQATKLQYVQPSLFATEIRGRLGQKLAEILPGDMDKVFFTLGGAEAIENAIKLARHYTGRYKVLARYRAYHGATMGAMTLTGDPRRWANEPGLVGVVRYPDTHRWGESEPRPVAESLQGLEDVIRYEGPHTIAAVFLETIVGTNGILIPPDGYIQGVREICDRNGILMVCDEVMAGFGRTGRWFAVDHWGIVPDLMTMAKGLTSSYLPLGAVAMRRHIAEAFDQKMYYGGLTYSSHPVSLAAALATIGVYEADDLLGNATRMGARMREHHERLAAKHPSIGAHRSLGLFGILDLVRSRDPWTPLTPFNGTSDEMKAIGRHFRDNGLYTMIANNSIHTNPPLCIDEEELAHGFDIIDSALDIADQAVTG
ncbi:MAG TPA: aminotransferase class III-fold pyridoxal phosphate-dependent enzyme [Candidatus Limnocylindrales bacterium]|jgi:taurine--2-oxoglutarate transaminase|nr:aminotransferase class III-fold pyridoxal phosphate-dependent enzyme [Candidatus Limnocylindrales bacterium]